MSVTEGVKVPTSFRNLSEFRPNGIAWYLWIAWAGFFICGCILSLIFMMIGLPVIPSLIIGILASGSLAYYTARDRKQAILTFRHIKILFKMTRKDHLFMKYRASIEDIKKIVPIESIEDSGVIRYRNGTSGIMIALSPPRISDDDIDLHNTRMMNVINALYGEYKFQFLSVSSAEIINELSRSTVESLNQPGTSQEVNDHLYSIYQYANNNKVNAVEWDFLLFVFLPYTKTVEEGNEMREAFMSGLSKELGRAKILSNIINNRNEVIILLRTLFTAKR